MTDYNLQPWAKYYDYTYGNLINDSAEKYADNEYLVFKDKRYTYRETLNTVNELARGLLDIGVKKGDRVAALLANTPEMIFAYYATAKIGAVIVPLNPALRVPEIERQLRIAECSTILFIDKYRGSDYVQMMKEVLPGMATSTGSLSENIPSLKNVIILKTEDSQDYPNMISYADIVSRGAKKVKDGLLEKAEDEVVATDPQCIYFSSGTTGDPKASLVPHRMIVAAFEGGSRFGWTEKDILLNPMPLFHIFGFQVVALSAMVFGAKVILLEAYDPEECLKLIEREKCTAAFGVPTMFQLMLDHPKFNDYNISTLKKGGMGAAPAPPALLRKLIDLGMNNVESFDGMSECSVHPQTFPTDSIDVIANTCGKSRTSLDMKIVDLQTGRLCPINVPGELLIRGDTMLIEYYNQPELTEERIDKNRWFRTGDIWKIDEEGNYTFISRADDVYNRGGEMISPVEVQNAIMEHPKVQLAEVVGVPDPLLGQEGAAFIILHKNETCSDSEIKEFLMNKIAKYKIPKYYIFTDQFPTTASGKVQKFKLVEKAVEIYFLK